MGASIIQVLHYKILITKKEVTHINVIVVVLGLGGLLVVSTQGQVMDFGTLAQVHPLKQVTQSLVMKSCSISFKIYFVEWKSQIMAIQT